MEPTAAVQPHALRILRGSPNHEEMAAVTALLHRVAASRGEDPFARGRAPRPAAAWQRLEHRGRYADPRMWREAG